MKTGTEMTAVNQEFILRQPMFFVATAAPDGRVNLSPKGLDSLRIMGNDRIVWLNLSGSGNETAAHLRENPRMTLMFCAFEGNAHILRLYGTATTTHPGDKNWDELVSLFPTMAGSRQIFDMKVDRTQTSCGSGVPFMDLKAQRGPEEMLPFYDKMDPAGLEKYWSIKNTKSIDGKETGIFENR